MIGLVQVGAQAMADRYTYVPLIGVFIALAWGLAALAAGSIVALLRVTRAQVRHCTDNASVFGHALAATGQVDAAIEQFDEALRLRPEYPEALSNLGLALAAMNRIPESIERLKEAVRLSPGFAQARANLLGLQEALRQHR